MRFTVFGYEILLSFQTLNTWLVKVVHPVDGLVVEVTLVLHRLTLGRLFDLQRLAGTNVFDASDALRTHGPSLPVEHLQSDIDRDFAKRENDSEKDTPPSTIPKPRAGS